MSYKGLEKLYCRARKRTRMLMTGDMESLADLNLDPRIAADASRVCQGSGANGKGAARISEATGSDSEAATQGDINLSRLISRRRGLARQENLQRRAGVGWAAVAFETGDNWEPAGLASRVG